MVAGDVATMPAAGLLAGFRDRRLSPVEAVGAALARIERLDGRVNAFVLVDGDRAMEEARASEARWRAGRPQGLLDGVPVSIKDLMITNGWPTRRGSRTIDPAGPWNEDAPAVARLREHGAVLIGKTTTPEFGWKGVTDGPLTGITRNPWNLQRTPGGSSGGAAVAVALGMGALATGTDAGGSIRIPASFTGIFGFKPTFGRVPAYPPSPFASIAHIGPMTRTVADAALMLTVMAGTDAGGRVDWRDPLALASDGRDYRDGLDDGVRGLRIGYSPDLGHATVDPAVAAKVADAVAVFDELGAVVEAADPGFDNPRRTFEAFWFAGAARLVGNIDQSRRPLIDPGLLAVAQRGAEVTTAEYLMAMAARIDLGLCMGRFHATYDLLLTPTVAVPAFTVGQETPFSGAPGSWPEWTPFTYPFNLTGQPAASVPCGLTDDGLPVGLQIVGRRFDDAVVLRAARAFEAVRPFALPDLHQPSG